MFLALLVGEVVFGFVCLLLVARAFGFGGFSFRCWVRCLGARFCAGSDRVGAIFRLLL